MASGTAPPPPQHGPPPTPPRQPDPYESLIDERVRYTQRQVKGVDIAAGLLTLAVGGLAYLFVAALIDHWVVPGGLGPTGRLVLFLILACGALAYFVWRVLPLLIHRINPLFAAYTIEQSRPSLKNSLINLLFLRGQRAQIERDILSQRIYQGLERTAAADLSHVAADTAVDHSQVIHRGYLLAAVMAIAAIYLALSPKNPLVSFGRVMFPWSGIRAPTRVTIDRVEPGDSDVYQGDYVTLSAEVRGLDDDESVLLYYTTADGQSVNQAVPMTLSEGEYRHRCQLPPGPLGMQQETLYHIQAGDCTTQNFRLEVQPALSIRVDAVDYHYPEYTGLSDRTVERQGDVRAVEGTQVTVRATASHPIQQATLEMDCKAQFGLRMRSSGTAATGQFTLAMGREKPARPEHDSYQVRFRDAQGREDRRPTRHRIEVIPDLAPEVRLIEPPPDGAQFPVDGVLPLRVRAEDPDFALRTVALRLEVEGKGLLIPPLLNKSRPNNPHQGLFEGAYRFQPSKLGLKAGDKVVYLAEATDNKEPVANRTKTQARTLVLVPPQGQQSPQQRSEQGGQGADQPRNQDKQNDRSKQGDPKQQDRDDGKSQEGKPDKTQDKQNDSPARSDQMQADQPQPNDDSSKPQNQDQQNQQKQQGQKSGQQDQGGQSGQGDSSASGEGKGQSGKSTGKQDQSASPQSGQKDQGDPSQEGDNQAQSQDGSSSSMGGQDTGQKRDGQAGDQSGQPQQPVDGQSNPGDVFDKALARRAEQKNADGKSESSREAAGLAPRDSQQNADGKQQNAGDKQPNADGKQQSDDGKSQSTREAAGLAPRDSQQSADGKQQSADGKQQSADAKQQSADGKSQSSRVAAELAPRDSKQNADAKPDASGAMTEPKPGGDAGKKPGSDNKPEASQSVQPKDTGKPDKGSQKSPTADSGERPDQRGGDRESRSGSADKGQSAEEKKAGALPQDGPRDRPKNAGPGDQKPPQAQDSTTSPSTDHKTSDSQGDMGGDRSGGGQQGGGQTSKQAGKDTAGTHSDAEKGASRSEQKGDGQTGDKGGDQVKSDRPTGQSAKADGLGSRQQSGDGKQPSPDGKPQDPDGKSASSREAAELAPRGSQPPQGGQPTDGGPQPGAGHPTGGGMPGPQPDATPPDANQPGDPYNREFAEKQTTLALEYLKDQLAKEKPDPKLLDQLGWSRQDLEKFVSRWENMRRAAAEPGPSGEAAKRQFDEALKSLGLRPRGTVLRGGSTNRDQMRNLKEAGRFDPPPEWSEMLRAYNRGVAGGKE